MKSTLKKILLGLAALLAWFFVHTALVCFDGFTSYPGRAEVALVMGNTVYADSSLAPWLKGRMDIALHLYQEGRVSRIFISGGKGEYGVAEAAGMKSYLDHHLVPDSVVTVDMKGQNTFATAEHFVRWAKDHDIRSAIVVTSFYHVTRSKYIIGKLGFSQIHSIASKSYFLWDYFGLFREFVAFYKYLIWY